MIHLDPKICQQVRQERRKARLSQSELAREVGCGQSALSMFEQGDGTKLNDEVIHKLCEKFKIELKSSEELKEDAAAASPRPVVPSALIHGFCPNPDCPSNHGYQVDGETFLLPHRHESDPVGGQFCALCGEILEKKCPTCGAPLHDGAVCSHCGNRYVAVIG